MNFNRNYIKLFAAELIGTFILVLLGTGAIELFEPSTSNRQLLISIAFFLGVFIPIILFGKTSGAHINPVITIIAVIEKKISALSSIIYISAQLIGEILASLIVFNLSSGHSSFGATVPSIPYHLNALGELHLPSG